MEPFEIQVPEILRPWRLDAYLARHFADLFSREEIKSSIEKGHILLNSKPTKPGVQIKCKDTISGSVMTVKKQTLEPEKISLNILYEDSEILVVDKPAGMVVHPGAGNATGTLANALAGRQKPLSDLSGVLRPGIVHRLDKDTSGVILTAKTNKAHRNLQDQFASRTVTKIYTALVRGRVEFEEGHIDKAIGADPRVRRKMAVTQDSGDEGRYAQTLYRVLERFKSATLLEVRILTGRTHQIRVHMAHLGHPVIGDELYGAQNQTHRLMLHASKIVFVHPKSGKMMQFESPLPEEFVKSIDYFKK